MKTILMIVGLLISSCSWAALLPPIPSQIVAGRYNTDLTDLIILGADSPGNGDFTTLSTANGVAYQVPAGKTLTIDSVYYNVNLAAVSNGFSLLYGNTAVSNSASPPTSPVYMFGLGSPPTNIFAGAIGIYQMPVGGFQVPAGKYPAITTNGSVQGDLFFYGYLH